MYFPSICRIIYVIESFKIHFCVGIASLVTGMKDETVSTPTPVPLNLSADFKFDQTFDGTVNSPPHWFFILNFYAYLSNKL